MADCGNCKVKSAQASDVPYIVHEASMARSERTVKRLWATIILLILLFVGSNAAWLFYESQFEYSVTTTETYESDADDGGTAIISGDGDISINGES